MKKLGFIAMIAAAAMFAGCQSSNKGSMGAVEGQKAKECCGKCDGAKANMGAVEGKKSCGDKSSCGTKTDANMGAVEGKKACGAKATCGGQN